MCGMGRTGYLYACDAEAIAQIYLYSKGLGAGYQPLAQCFVLLKFIMHRNGSGLFQHGHTYLGHPVAAAAAKAELKKS